MLSQKTPPQDKENDKDKENEKKSLGGTTQEIMKKLRGREYIAKVPKIPITRKKPYSRDNSTERADPPPKEEAKPNSTGRGLSPIGEDM